MHFKDHPNSLMSKRNWELLHLFLIVLLSIFLCVVVLLVNALLYLVQVVLVVL